MSDERHTDAQHVLLAEIRARHEAIIPGPWRWYGNTATDQVFLATVDRGRLFIMSPGVRTMEYVYHYGFEEGYDKSSVSNTKVREWCGAHDEQGGNDARQCICDEIAEFLKDDLDPDEGHRNFRHPRSEEIVLTRVVRSRADLRFPVPFPGGGLTHTEAAERKKQHGGLMRSYRERMPRYEVLGYRTVQEWEMDQGGVMDAHEALYREDFAGLDNPEADFIQHSAEDVKFLLDYIDELRQEIAEADIEDLKDAAHD